MFAREFCRGIRSTERLWLSLLLSFFVSLCTFPSSKAQEQGEGLHLQVLWTAWDKKEELAQAPGAWLEALEPVDGWLQERHFFGRERDWAGSGEDLSVLDWLSQRLGSVNNRSIWVDLYIKSHGSKLGLAQRQQDCRTLYHPDDFLREAVNKVAQSLNSAEGPQNVKFRFFAAYCYSGQLIAAARRWQSQRGASFPIEVEIYTSTGSESISYSGDLERSLLGTDQLMKTLRSFWEGAEVTEQLPLVFAMLGRFGFCSPGARSCHPPEFWSTQGQWQNRAFLSSLLRLVKHHDPAWRKAQLSEGGNTWSSRVFQQIELAFKAPQNHQLKELVVSAGLEGWEEEETWILSYLQLRYFYRSIERPRMRLVEFLEHRKASYRYLGIQLLSGLVKQGLIAKGEELMIKSYWREKQRDIVNFRILRHIARHFQEQSNLSLNANALVKDWRQTMMAHRNEIIEQGVFSCEALMGNEW